MPFQLVISLLFLFSLIACCIWYFKSKYKFLIVQEGLAGVLYDKGKVLKILGPGRYRISNETQSVELVDMRESIMTVAGQELLSLDGASIKVSVLVNYKIEDAAKILISSQNYYSALHAAVQLALRQEINGLTIDQLLENRNALGPKLLELVLPQIQDLGISVRRIDLRDLTFSGELKKVFAEVTRARKEGQAALERARAEAAALRSLANSAKMLEANPALLSLRALLSSGSSNNNSIVLHLPAFSTATNIQEQKDKVEP